MHTPQGIRPLTGPIPCGGNTRAYRTRRTSGEARDTPFPPGVAKTAFCSFPLLSATRTFPPPGESSLLLPYQNQSQCFDFERKTEGTDMELSRLFATGEAEWSEFRLTTARGLTRFGSRVFEGAKLPQKRILIYFSAVAENQRVRPSELPSCCYYRNANLMTQGRKQP